MPYGPDPDPNPYRFAINREVQRWHALRPRWVEAVDEASAEAIDAEMARCLNTAEHYDVTHSQDIATTLKARIDNLEQVLSLRKHASPASLLERARANARANSGKGLSLDIEPPPWRYQALYDEVRDRVGRITSINHGDKYRSARVAIPGFGGEGGYNDDGTRQQLPGHIVAHWRASANDPIAARLETACPLEVVLRLTREGGRLQAADSDDSEASVALTALEVTKSTGPRTALPGLRVTVPELPPGAPPELRAQMEQVRLAASTYDSQVDSRTPEEIAADDLRVAERNAGRNAQTARAELSYVPRFSDDPRNAPAAAPPIPPTPQQIAQALTVLYEAVGIRPQAVAVSNGNVQIQLPGGRVITTPIPEPLRSLLKL